MSKLPLRLWTGCELYMPMTISSDGRSATVRFPEYGDSFIFNMPPRTTLAEVISEIEAGDSYTAWIVMGWAICTRRDRWMKAAREHDAS